VFLARTVHAGPGSRQLERMCAPRSGGIKPQSISSNIEKLVVILTSVGLMRACLVLQLGWMLVVVVGKGDGGGGGVCVCVFSASPLQRANWLKRSYACVGASSRSSEPAGAFGAMTRYGATPAFAHSLRRKLIRIILIIRPPLLTTNKVFL